MNTKSDISILFEPYKLGDVILRNRIVMAALTRARCDPTTGVPNDLHVKYYAQRASAGLIFTECTPVSANSNTYPGAAGIYNKDQVTGWKRVVDAVHAKGGVIYNQIWHGGRTAHPNVIGGEIPIGPSAIAIKGNFRKNIPHVQPREMNKEDFEAVREQFRQGALNAKEAGFDGIELHGGNGYLIDEFLRDGSNQRTDEYGGSPEKRCKFPLEIMDILIEVFGAGRVGIKLSPVSRYQDIYDSNPVATFGHLLEQLSKKNIAFVQFHEAEDGMDTVYEAPKKQLPEVSKTLRPYYKGSLIINGDQTAESVAKAISGGYADLGSFGRAYMSNPDLVERMKNGWDLAPPAEFRAYYGGGEKGYSDYPDYMAKVEGEQAN